MRHRVVRCRAADRRWAGAAFVAAGLALGPVALTAVAAAAAELRFVDMAPAAGVTAPTWCGRPEKPHILESGGTGLALFDYDGDGDLDLYLVNGWRLEGNRVAERGATGSTATAATAPSTT